jgi:hypothetical protein
MCEPHCTSNTYLMYWQVAALLCARGESVYISPLTMSCCIRIYATCSSCTLSLLYGNVQCLPTMTVGIVNVVLLFPGCMSCWLAYCILYLPNIIAGIQYKTTSFFQSKAVMLLRHVDGVLIDTWLQRGYQEDTRRTTQSGVTNKQQSRNNC